MQKNLNIETILPKVKEMAYEALFELLPISFFWIDREGNMLGCNQEQITQLDQSIAENYLGKHTREIASPEAWENSKRVMDNDQAEIFEENRFDPQGNLLNYLSIKSPLKNAQGEVIGLLGVAINITAMRKHEKLLLEKEKQDAEKAREYAARLKTMAGSIAHELRTPLAGIKLGLQGLKNYLPNLLDGYHQAVEAKLVKAPLRKTTLDALDKLLERTINQANAGNAIIDIQLQNMRPDQIDSKSFKHISINDVISHAVESYPFTNSQRVLVNYHFNEDINYLADPTLLKHILWNLIKNAIYFIQAEEKGILNIWTEQTKTEFQIHVKDTAKGISPHIAAKIFDEFYSNRQDGTGLGLSFCKMVMESFGGSITCNSKENEYTEFVLHFPLKL